MITTIAKLLGVDKWLVGAVVGVVLISAVWGAVAYIDHRGYVRAEAKYTAEIAQIKADIAAKRAAEIERQEAANNAAKAREAERRAADAAIAEQLKNQIEVLQREADQDPDAGRAALGASSVQRINKIR
jgi:hypothetical protein